MEGAVSPDRETTRREARAPADATGHPALRTPRAAQPARHHAELRRVRGRRRPDRPQADPLQAVHRSERGDAAHPHRPKAERAGRNRLAHTGVGEEPDDALARAQAPPRRVAAATHRGHRHRPHQARPANHRSVHRVRVPKPRARGQRARSAAHPRAPDRQDGDDHHPEVPGDRRRRRRRAAGSGPPHAVRGCQHLRDGGRGPPHAVPEPRREHAPGAAQRLLPRLHRHPHRQEGPEHAAHLRPLPRHLHHRAGGRGQGDGAHLLREPAPGTPHHRTDHRPGLRPRLRRPHRRRAGRHQAALRHRASNRRRPAPHRGDLPGPHRPLHAVHRPQRIQGPGGCDEPPRRGHLQGGAGPAERSRVGRDHVGGPQRRGVAGALAPAQGRAGPAHRTVQGPRRPTRHPGGMRHAAHRIRRADRAGDVP